MVASPPNPILRPQPGHPFTWLAHTFTYYRFPAAHGGHGPAQMADQHVTSTRLEGPCSVAMSPMWTTYLFSAYLPQPLPVPASVTCPDVVNSRVPHAAGI